MTTWAAAPREVGSGEPIDGEYVHLGDDGTIRLVCYRECEVSVDELRRIGLYLVNLANHIEQEGKK